MSSESLTGQLELLKEYIGPFGIETPGQAIDRCIAILRQHEAELPPQDWLQKTRAAFIEGVEFGRQDSFGNLQIAWERSEANEICADAIRRRQIEQPHDQSLNISPEHVQKVERIERDEPPRNVVERVARALAEIDCRAQSELLRVFGEAQEDEAICIAKNWPGYVSEAKAAIAAMSLRSVDLSDAIGKDKQRYYESLGKLLETLLLDPWTEECQECGIGRSDEWVKAKALQEGARAEGVEVTGAAPDSLIDILEGMERYKSVSGDWIRLKETIAAIRQYLNHHPLPAWSEDGFKAACADMAVQIQSAKNGGSEELLAKNVCVSSLCVAYKNSSTELGQ
jgi:hypothetical protein